MLLNLNLPVKASNQFENPHIECSEEKDFKNW